MANQKSSFTLSSGNIFADLGFADAEELEAKVRLGIAIAAIINQKCLTQAQIGKKLQISQPKVSAIVNHKFVGFSVERLIHFLTCLECEVRIDISPVPSKEKKGCVRVVGIGIDLSGAASLDDDNCFGTRKFTSDHIQTGGSFMPHSLEEYACAFGLDKLAPPMSLPRMT